MFLYNISQQHVSALSWSICRLNTFLCEVNHTVNNVIQLLSTRSRVTSFKFIHLKLITIVVELKSYYNIKDIKSRMSQSRKGSGGARIGKYICLTIFKYVSFFIGYSVVA